MARSDGIWQKVKKTISNEIRDDERLAANLAGKDLCVITRELLTGQLPLVDFVNALNSCMKVKYTEYFGDPPIHIEEFKLALEKFRRNLKERMYEKRLLRAVALFAGSVFVMRNFGELMAVLEHMWIKSRFTEKVTEPTRTKDLTAVECPLVKDMYV